MNLRLLFKGGASFVTAHTFCASRDIRVLKEFATNTTIFLRGLGLCGTRKPNGHFNWPF